jgi:hypothetical protein
MMEVSGMKILLVALALTGGLMPGFAMAQGCHGEERAQMSCAEGKTWDPASKSCVTVGA